MQKASPKEGREEKKMAGELSSDEPILEAHRRFEVQVHNVILDKAIESMKARFKQNESLCLLPLQFDFVKSSLPENALANISEVLVKYDEEATKENLQLELVSLANNWEKLKKSLTEEYKMNSDCDEDTCEEEITNRISE